VRKKAHTSGFPVAENKSVPFFARKSLGQHFLHDRNIIRKIIAAIGPQPEDHFVEIGPGRGALTIPLLEIVRRLDVIELDRSLAEALRQEFGQPGFTVHRADALKFDFGSLTTEPRALRLAGNLPYNISTPLLFRLLDHEALFRDMHVMLQKEVVQRMTARPGTKAYGRLTVTLAARCRVESLFTIRPGAFAPPPRVDSAFARLIPDATLADRIKDFTVFGAVITTAFSMRRKRLANALRAVLTETQIESADVDPGLRPEDLAPEAYVRLANLRATLRL
jgi:16S rRNA (adenine1518-N6/adenine1519-N6)-dimethyltransferase